MSEHHATSSCSCEWCNSFNNCGCNSHFLINMMALQENAKSFYAVWYIFASVFMHFSRNIHKIYQALTLAEHLPGWLLYWTPQCWIKYSKLLSKSSAKFLTTKKWENAGERLLTLKQGKLSAADFSLRFCTLAVESGCNETALKTMFQQGLNDVLQIELPCRDA